MEPFVYTIWRILSPKRTEAGFSLKTVLTEACWYTPKDQCLLEATVGRLLKSPTLALGALQPCLFPLKESLLSSFCSPNSLALSTSSPTTYPWTLSFKVQGLPSAKWGQQFQFGHLLKTRGLEFVSDRWRPLRDPLKLYPPRLQYFSVLWVEFKFLLSWATSSCTNCSQMRNLDLKWSHSTQWDFFLAEIGSSY